MPQVKQYKQIELEPQIVEESSTPYGLRTYISLFSSAGVGCYGFKEENTRNFAMLSKIAELANAQRYNNAAYYTRQDICFSIIKNLPDAKNYTTLNILEPSIGVGNFLPNLINKYKSVPIVNIDVVDIDENSIELLKELIKKMDVPDNININYINADFLLYSFNKRYDIVAYNAYYVQKAIALIQKIQRESEVHDQWGNGEATQVHHIFPKALFPEIAHYFENLIKLTATQHYTKAHPNNKTQEISKNYQLTCLLAKTDTIDKSLQRFGEKYYRKESFIYVCNTGLSVNLEINITLSNLKTLLIQIYNDSK